MTNFVPGASLILILPFFDVAQTSPVTLAPTAVLLVVSDVTVPAIFSSARSEELTVHFFPVLVVSLSPVVLLFDHVTVESVDVALPMLVPEPPVFPLQPVNLMV